MIRFTALATAALLAVSPAAADWSQPSEKAIKLARENLIVDGHVDIPFRLYRNMEDISVRTPGGDFDYVRAKAGGMDAPFMSIYVPASYQETGGAYEFADELITLVEGIAQANPDKFEMAYTTDDVKRIFKEGKIALPMGMENGAPIGTDLANLDYFYGRGIRYITLAHSRANAISDSSYDINRPNGGLSPFGEQVVRRMNELGIMIDISHVSDESFYDVLALTDAPVIASHSSLRHFTTGFERNMSDEMVAALGENDGVIMINYGSSFLTNAYQEWSQRYNAAFNKFVQENNIEPTPEVRQQFEKGYIRTAPKPYATVEDVLNHIDRAVELAGINHVGLGSDFDGVGDSLPVGLKDASMTPQLIQGLMDRGYSNRQIKKIMGDNFMRVWRKVERVAD